jgi:hypothetical protein
MLIGVHVLEKSKICSSKFYEVLDKISHDLQSLFLLYHNPPLAHHHSLGDI